MPTHLREVAWLLTLVLFVLAALQYGTYLAPTSLSEFSSQSRFPDFDIYFADARYDMDSRRIAFRLQINVRTATDQGHFLYFGFHNSLTGGFTKQLDLVYQGEGEYAYQYNEAGISDLMYGLSERYPYDYYQIDYTVSAGVDTPFDFREGFIPDARAHMVYPESLRWQITASASEVTQTVSDAGYLVSFRLVLKVERMLGYSSMISLFPVWAASVVLASSLFLVDDSERKRPRIRDRLAIYISLFVFIPGFMFLLASQVSIRWLFSTSEIFLAALLSSTAAFVAFSALSHYQVGHNWDRYAVALSILSYVSFIWIDPLFYTWDTAGLDPFHTLTVDRFMNVLPLFVDARVVPWIILIAATYLVPYAKVHRDFKSSRLAILLVGALVFCLTSLRNLHDPTIVLVSAGYILLSWREIGSTFERGLKRVTRLSSRERSAKTETTNLDGAPESWNDDSSTMLDQIDAWIGSGHPKDCLRRAQLVLSQTTHRYSITAQRLVIHCVEQHGQGIDMIVAMYSNYHIPTNERGLGFTQCILTNQTRLCDEVLTKFDSHASGNAERLAVNLVVRHIDDQHFWRVWKELWTKGLAIGTPELAGAVFQAAAFSSRAPFAIELANSSLDELYGLIPEVLVLSLVRSPQMRPAQNSTLDKLLAMHGPGAAKAIILASQYADPIPSCIPSATRILLQANPDDSIVMTGLGLSLGVDPKYAIPIIVKLVNDGKTIHYDRSFFEWKIQQSKQKPLLDALATDAIGRDGIWHSTLAQIHHDLIRDTDAVVERIAETLQLKEACKYNAALIVHYLSEPRVATVGAVKKFVENAAELHHKYGSRDEASVRRDWNLTDRKLRDYEKLLAIALAKDVLNPPESVDGERVLATIKALPFTYKALGSAQLDAEVRKGDLPPFSALYAVAESAEVDAWTRAWIARSKRFRESWEKRFAKISKAGIDVPSRRLRNDRNVWNEMRILAQLVDYFEVEYEPENIHGMGTSRPEFLLKCCDGDLIFEVASISTKPEDVREGAKLSTGGIAKKTLQNKLREKFGNCQGEYEVPIVIAVVTQWMPWDEYDVENSLYGPLGLSVSMKGREIVAEGATRDAEKAFFNADNVQCISAIAGIGPSESDDRYLDGKLYRPLKTPRVPVSVRLWVRLRDALFGPSQERLLAEMNRIPTISREEAKALVEHGADDVSFFAAGLIAFPEGLDIQRARFGQLQEQAMRLALIGATGRINYLQSARGADLSPLWQEGIYTISQLLERKSRPPKVQEELWIRLKEEAATLSAIVPQHETPSKAYKGASTSPPQTQP